MCLIFTTHVIYADDLNEGDDLESIMLKDIENARKQKRPNEVGSNEIRRKQGNEHVTIEIERNLHPIVSVSPIYPGKAIEGEIEGEVTLKFLVGSNNKPTDIEVVQSTDAIFERSSIRSVQKWLYHPRNTGESVLVTYKFILKK